MKGPGGARALIIITMINFFRRIRNLPAGKAGKMADDISCSFFAAPKKERKKGAFFYEVFFMLFYRTHKNRLKSAKFLPGLHKFLTRFSNYTDVKDSIQRNILVN